MDSLCLARGAFDAELAPVTQGEEGRHDCKGGPKRKRVTPGEAPTLRPSGKDGSITAADSSPLSDGAVALVLMNAKEAEDLGLEPLARVVRTPKSWHGGVHSTDNLFSLFARPCKSIDFPSTPAAAI